MLQPERLEILIVGSGKSGIAQSGAGRLWLSVDGLAAVELGSLFENVRP
jgi:hypothetical protein